MFRCLGFRVWGVRVGGYFGNKGIYWGYLGIMEIKSKVLFRV